MKKIAADRNYRMFKRAEKSQAQIMLDRKVPGALQEIQEFIDRAEVAGRKPYMSIETIGGGAGALEITFHVYDH